jgi:PAS domain S-box-containing protein
MGEKELRKTGIDFIGNTSWGTHFCQFYQTPEDLIDILVPYFKAGLENNEFCMWITAEPLNAKKAKANLKKIVRNLDDYIEKGQIEILDYSQWYTKSGKFDADEVLDSWVEKEKQALEKGFDGLRLTGNTFWLEDKDWRGFTAYEKMINDVIGNYKIIAVCSYSLDKCGATEIMDVVANHQFALVKRENRWEIIESSERKQAEEALRESEEKYSSLVESTEDSIYLVDRECRYLFMNEKHLSRFGLPIEKVIGSGYGEFHSEVETKDFLKKVNEIFQTDKSLSYEHRSPKDSRYFLRTLSPVKEPDGRIVSITVVSKDITDRKQAEEDIKSSEVRFRELFNNMSSGVGIYEARDDGNDFIIKDYNRAGELISKVNKEHIVGRSALEVFPGIKQFGLFEVLQRVWKTGESEHHPVSLYQDDYLTHWAENYVYKLPSGEIVAVFDDVTERKQAEAALRESETQKKAILDASIDRIRLVDTDMRIIWANKTTTREINIAPEDLLGQYCYKAFVGRDTPCLECPTKKALDSGKIEHAFMHQKSQRV